MCTLQKIVEKTNIRHEPLLLLSAMWLYDQYAGNSNLSDIISFIAVSLFFNNSMF
jgi:hypothetical protein